MGKVSKDKMPESGRWRCEHCIFVEVQHGGFGECHKKSPMTGKDGVAVWPRVLIGYHRCGDFEDVL